MIKNSGKCTHYKTTGSLLSGGDLEKTGALLAPEKQNKNKKPKSLIAEADCASPLGRGRIHGKSYSKKSKSIVPSSWRSQSAFTKELVRKSSLTEDEKDVYDRFVNFKIRRSASSLHDVKFRKTISRLLLYPDWKKGLNEINASRKKRGILEIMPEEVISFVDKKMSTPDREFDDLMLDPKVHKLKAKARSVNKVKRNNVIREKSKCKTRSKKKVEFVEPTASLIDYSAKKIARSESGIMDFEFLSELKKLVDTCSFIRDLDFGPGIMLTRFGTFFYQCWRARSKVDFLAACFQFGTTFKLDKIGSILLSFGHTAYELFVSARAVVAESWSDRFEVAQSVLACIVSSKMFLRLRDLILAVTSYHWFNKDISKKVFKFFGKPRKLCILDFLEVSFQALISLFRFGENIAEGVPLVEALMMEDPVGSMITKLNSHLELSKYTVMGIDAGGAINLNTWLMEARDLQKAYRDFLENRASPLLPATKTLKLKVVEFESVIKAKYLQAKSQSRLTPQGIIVTGSPGIGKGRLIPHICSRHAAVMGREFTTDMIFHRSMTSDYWEGYDPLANPIIHYSELAKDTRERAKIATDPIFGEITTLIDSMAYPVNRAFGDKGEVFAMPELVICDTNNPLLNAKEQFFAPSAYLRRFIFIEPTVMTKFTKPGSTELDPERSLSEGGNLMDRWTFDVYYFVSTGLKARKEWYKRAIRIDELNDWLDSEFKKRHTLAVKIGEELEWKAPVDKMDMDILPKPASLELEEKEEVVLVAESGVLPSISLDWDDYGKAALQFVVAFVYLFAFFLLECFGKFKPTKEMLYAIPCSLFLESYAYNRVTLTVALTLTALIRALFYTSDIANGFAVKVGEKAQEKKAYWSNMLKYYTGYGYYCGYIAPKLQKHGQVLAMGVIAITTAFGVWRLWAKSMFPVSEASTFYVPAKENKKLSELEDEFECGGTVKRVRCKLYDAWNVQEYGPVSKHTGTRETLAMHVYKNVYSVAVPGSETRTAHALGICSDFAIVNTHILPPKLPATIYISRVPQKNIEAMRPILLTEKCVEHVGPDLSLIRTRGTNFHDIRKHIWTKSTMPPSFPGIISGTEVRAKLSTEGLIVSTHGEKLSYAEYFEYEWTSHSTGSCGLPLIVSKDAGASLVGMHFAGHPTKATAFAAPLTKSQVDRAVTLLKKKTPFMVVHSEGKTLASMNLVDPTPKSMLRFEHLPRVKYFGKEAGPVLTRGKSSLVKKDFPELVEFAFMQLGKIPGAKFDKPVMAPFMRKGEYISPHNIAARKYGKIPPTLNPIILEECITEIVERVVKGLPDGKWTPYTIEAAINGLATDGYWRRMNLTTSAGHPYVGIKSKFIPTVIDDGVIKICEPISEIKEKLTTLIETMLAEDTVQFVTVGCLKDEPRKVIKVKAGKTRVFYITSQELVILARAFLGRFYSSMVECSPLFCTLVGINMHTDVDDLVEELNAFSPLLCEGDYASYDQSMPFDIGLAASTIVERVCKAKGYNSSAMKVVRGLLTEGLLPVVSIYKDIMVVPGLQVSGKYATAEDNSLRGKLMPLYAFKLIKELKGKSFFDSVLLKTYGDDLLFAVKPDIAPFFNAVVYRDICRDHFNMDFTAAVKDAELKPLISIEEATLLKRNFVYRKDLKRWVAPLSFDSILKSFEWKLPSRSISMEMQSRASAASSLWELFFHCDSKQYDIVRDVVIQRLYSLYGSPKKELELELPQFEDIRERICA